MENENVVAIRAATEEAKALASLPAEVKSANWGEVEATITNDLIVPKIYQQQSNSEFAKSGVARAGDFCDSLTGEVLATKDEPLLIIVFGGYKTMLIKKQIPGKVDKYELEEVIRITPENAIHWANHPYVVDTPEGKKKYGIFYHFYCFVAGKETGLPFILSLGSTKTPAARRLTTLREKLKSLGRSGSSIVFELRSVSDANDQGDWFNIEVAQGRNATAEEMQHAYDWHKKSLSQKITAPEEAATEEVEPWENEQQ